MKQLLQLKSLEKNIVVSLQQSSTQQNKRNEVPTKNKVKGKSLAAVVNNAIVLQSSHSAANLLYIATGLIVANALL